MPAPRKYPQELRERAVRLVQEARVEEPTLSVTAAVTRIGAKVGVNPATLRGWMKQIDIDAGRRPGTTTDDARKIKDLEREVRELKRANEILLAASTRPRWMPPPFDQHMLPGLEHRQSLFIVEDVRTRDVHRIHVLGCHRRNARLDAGVPMARGQRLTTRAIAEYASVCWNPGTVRPAARNRSTMEEEPIVAKRVMD